MASGQQPPRGDQAIANLLKNLVDEGIENKISDIHFEPCETTGRVRYRIDGLLETGYVYAKTKLQSLIARVKLLTGLNITETREIQEGLLRWQDRKSGHILIDFRVSVIPTVRGEKVVLRRLVGENNILPLEELGFSSMNLRSIQRLISSNQGLIFVSGPTGSGKTTTLFACLQGIMDDKLNIITLEDPVEIYLDGVNQIQVNTAAGEKFADKLRAVLRQDPDVIMVGEIRDLETAGMAVRAALTGHLVLTTIHTLDALGVIIRLREMGIPSYLIAETLLGVMAQRLIRKLCRRCQGEGCSDCRQRGYRGRTALQEIIPIDADCRQSILRESSRENLLEELQKSEFASLQEDGSEKVDKNITDMREVRRVLR